MMYLYRWIVILIETTTENQGQYVLVVTEKGYGKRVLCDFRSLKRGCKGVIIIKFKAKAGTDRIAGLRVCTDGDDVVMSTNRGTIIRQSIKNISIQSRTATGVLLQNIPSDDAISMVDVVPPAKDDTAVIE